MIKNGKNGKNKNEFCLERLLDMSCITHFRYKRCLNFSRLKKNIMLRRWHRLEKQRKENKRNFSKFSTPCVACLALPGNRSWDPSPTSDRGREGAQVDFEQCPPLQ